MNTSPRNARAGTGALALALVAVAWLGAATQLAAQDAPAPDPTSAPDAEPPAAPVVLAPAGTAMARPATVNGQSITPEDIANHVRLLGDESGAGTEDERRHFAQRMIGEEILLSGECKRLGVEMSDREVDDYWTRRRGSLPDYDLMAKEMGTTVERQRELARRAAMSQLYLLHKVGLRTDLAQKLPPDPLLVRLVTITPSQLREAFEENRALLSQPATIVCDVYAFSKATDVGTLEEALGTGALPPDVEPVRRAFPEPALGQVFPPELASFLLVAEPGAVRGAQASDGVLLLKVISRTPGQLAEFASSQENLHRMLQTQLLGDARAQLVGTLAGQATFWPRDLFSAAATKPATELKAPETPAQGSVAKPGTPP